MGGAAGTSLGGAGASGSAGASGAAGTSGTGGVGGVTGNLITNGDFSQGELDWHITDAQGNPVMASLMDGAYCVYTGNTSNVGWPDVPAKAISLEPGATYTLSFRTRGGYSNAQARFGLAAPPYTPIFMSDWFYQPDASGSWTPRTYQFSATGSEASGLVFTVNFASGSSFICFDDVVLVKN
jgi:hypothetical protein